MLWAGAGFEGDCTSVLTAVTSTHPLQHCLSCGDIEAQTQSGAGACRGVEAWEGGTPAWDRVGMSSGRETAPTQLCLLLGPIPPNPTPHRLACPV